MAAKLPDGSLSHCKKHTLVLRVCLRVARINPKDLACSLVVRGLLGVFAHSDRLIFVERSGKSAKFENSAKLISKRCLRGTTPGLVTNGGEVVAKKVGVVTKRVGVVAKRGKVVAKRGEVVAKRLQVVPVECRNPSQAATQ